MSAVRESTGSPGTRTSGTPTGTLRDLICLIGYANSASRRLLTAAIAATALAAIADVASLALLQRTATGLLGTAHGGSATGASSTLVAFLGAALAGSVLRYWAQRRTVTAQYAMAESLAITAFRNLQNQDYADYIANGGSEGFAAFDRLQLVSFNALSPLIVGAAALLTVVAVLGAIFVLYPIAALLLLLAPLGLIRRKREAAVGLSELAHSRARLVFEARTAFRDIFLINAQSRVVADFADLEHAIRLRQSRAVRSVQSSRHGFEIAALSLALALVLLFPLPSGGQLRFLPVFGVLGLATLRILPSAAILRASLRSIGLHGDLTSDVLTLLQRVPQQVGLSGNTPTFQREIVLAGITVRRPGRPDALNALDLTIPRGARIGLIGASGAGKSTLLDVICGAIEPDAGSMLIDDIPLDRGNSAAWRNRIGIVSQHAVLLGRTLHEVVTYPEPPGEANAERFAAAVAKAGVGRMSADFTHGLETEVGEALATLSGGQRQRLALAHALYRARDLLLLDEATGQLDAESEAAVIEAIVSLPRDLAVVVVTHRPALLECCDTNYRLVEGRLVRVD